MIFISKRNIRHRYSSNQEACFSIVGLFLAIGFIGGLTGLIYGNEKQKYIYYFLLIFTFSGLVKGSSSGTIAGAIVLGASIFLIVIFIFIVVLCLKNNNMNSNTNQQQQQQRRRHRQRKQKRQTEHENSSHEIQTISTVQRHEQTNDMNRQMFPSSIPNESIDKKDYGFAKYVISPSSKSSAFTYLNESHSSINSNIVRQNNYDRH
ncbi:unnamed protein product [Rotaria sordida]|uniref:Uncharacterized protein n=1 Tax=Rotaria sordida TaxID=392033 RepID=A0A814APX5_9BILA|nr:unnamed protein product [Rotaria sordida]